MAQGFARDYIVPTGPTRIFINGVEQASTSGTEIPFSIPSGIKFFVISFDDVSLSGTNSIRVRLGDSGGLATSGYVNNSTRLEETGNVINIAGLTDGFNLRRNSVGDACHGHLFGVLQNESENKWTVSANVCFGNNEWGLSVGTVSLNGELTDIEIDASGADTFDSGDINLQYENPDLGVTTAGGVVQTAHVIDGDLATGTTTIPADDTIPQITEGDEYMTLAFTPKASTNWLKIDVVVNTSSSNNNQRGCVALFQDSTADALAAAFTNYDGNVTVAPHNVKFTYWMQAGTVSETTFRVRIGYPLAGTTSFNGFSGTRNFGGVMASSITIKEYSV